MTDVIQEVVTINFRSYLCSLSSLAKEFMVFPIRYGEVDYGTEVYVEYPKCFSEDTLRDCTSRFIEYQSKADKRGIFQLGGGKAGKLKPKKRTVFHQAPFFR